LRGENVTPAIDIHAYCRRIGYAGELAPTLPVLRALMEHHTTTVPFENLDVLLGRQIQLTAEALERKIVGERRGGYCFEQNGLFLHVLEGIGFKVRPLGARVRLMATRDVTPARTHLLLRLDIEGESWLADVGIGAVSPMAPLLLHAEDEQPTPQEARRIVREEGRFFHQMRNGDVWSDVYEFTLEEMPLIDRELANWWTSAHPNSRFRQFLMAAKANRDGTRYSLQNREFTHRRGGEVLAKQDIGDAEQLLELLESRFGLVFPEGTRFGKGDMGWPT
jgi:N-hydroxyarylamine O-acetyltransferase